MVSLPGPHHRFLQTALLVSNYKGRGSWEIVWQPSFGLDLALSLFYITLTAELIRVLLLCGVMCKGVVVYTLFSHLIVAESRANTILSFLGGVVFTL